jgi:hypothetical protein
MRLAPARVVAEDARRDDAGRGKGEAAERAPDEVLGAGESGERDPQGRVRAGRSAEVKYGEVGVLLRRLDEAAAQARLPQDGLKVLGQEIPGDVERSRAEALGDLGR